MNVLINFRHGLGDAVQLTVVLKHLQKYRPNWNVDVAALAGKHSACRGLCRNIYVLNQDSVPCCKYRQRFNLDWHECPSSLANVPSTKASRCLQEVFQIPPDPELCRYSIQRTPEADARTRKYLQQVCTSLPPLARGGQGGSLGLESDAQTTLDTRSESDRRAGQGGCGEPATLATNHNLPSFNPEPTATASFANDTPIHAPAHPGTDVPGSPVRRYPVVLIHYQGNTSTERKDLPHELARVLCDTILDAGFVPVILDWDRRSPLPDGRRIHCPEAGHELWGGLGTGDAGILASLIEFSSLMIGVDSGPLHVAGATTTPTIGVWMQHHPVHYFDLADNVLHLVPGDHEHLAAGPEARACFQKHYRHRTYKQLHVDLPAVVESRLTGQDVELLANKRFLGELRSTSFDRRYYEEHKQAGLDYLGFGPWQLEYGRWLVDSFGLKGKRLLDVGCACGSILRGLGSAGAVVQGVDVNEHAVQLGRETWPDMAPLLFVCDAVNLHLFEDGSWDALHSAQVAEHWKPKLVPHILEELHRITRPGALFFCALDTEELFARQGRRIEHEDPTHVCIRTMSWWHERLQEAGWQVCTADFEPALRAHPESFLTHYDWDWFVARRS